MYIEGYKKIEIELTRIIEIKTTGPPSPYANKENPEGFKIEIYPSSHENFNDVYSWILNLYDISKDNNPGNYFSLNMHIFKSKMYLF